MSAATLNVWITKIGDPCHITSATYFVDIFDCEGRILEWCGKKYQNLPAKCGHLQVEVPPGCYAVFAVEFPAGIPPFGNLLTHLQVVRVNCGDHACITLFAPSAHLCGSWFGSALRGNLEGFEKAGIARDVVQGAIAAVDRLVQALPAEGFEANVARIGEELPPRDRK